MEKTIASCISELAFVPRIPGKPASPGIPLSPIKIVKYEINNFKIKEIPFNDLCLISNESIKNSLDFVEKFAHLYFPAGH